MSKEKKTIYEWEKVFNLKIMDPDGFDRSDPELYNRLFTQHEFEKGMSGSSIIGLPIKVKDTL